MRTRIIVMLLVFGGVLTGSFAYAFFSTDVGKEQIACIVFGVPTGILPLLVALHEIYKKCQHAYAAGAG